LASASIWLASWVARSTVALISVRAWWGWHVAAQRRLHLGLQHRQRRAQLVRGVAHKAFLVVQQVLQPLHHLVGGVHQRQQLARGVRGFDAAQVALGAGLQLGADAAHRAGGALHHHHGHQRNHGHQHGLAPQGVDQDAPRQRLAQLQRLGHLDHGHAAAIGAGHRLQQHGHAHRLVAKAAS
jgi:hypothetical protein